MLSRTAIALKTNKNSFIQAFASVGKPPNKFCVWQLFDRRGCASVLVAAPPFTWQARSVLSPAGGEENTGCFCHMRGGTASFPRQMRRVRLHGGNQAFTLSRTTGCSGGGVDSFRAFAMGSLQNDGQGIRGPLWLPPQPPLLTHNHAATFTANTVALVSHYHLARGTVPSMHFEKSSLCFVAPDPYLIPMTRGGSFQGRHGQACRSMVTWCGGLKRLDLGLVSSVCIALRSTRGTLKLLKVTLEVPARPRTVQEYALTLSIATMTLWLPHYMIILYTYIPIYA